MYYLIYDSNLHSLGFVIQACIHMEIQYSDYVFVDYLHNDIYIDPLAMPNEYIRSRNISWQTALYSIHKEKVWFSELLEYVTSGVAVIFALRKENAIQDLRNLVGPTDPNEARKTDPDTLRALYGSSKQANAIHCSDSYENACRELEIFFPCNSFNGDVSFSSSSSSSSDSSSSSESSSVSSSISTESS